MAASQPFDDDRDVIFGRVDDGALADTYNIHKFPALLLIKKDNEDPYE